MDTHRLAPGSDLRHLPAAPPFSCFDFVEETYGEGMLPAIQQQFMPEAVWAVEISIPQLFPANERKLGEIILDATKPMDYTGNLFSNFVLARMPGTYFFAQQIDKPPQMFMSAPSSLQSHLPVIR
jgi:hypothetical protein